MVGFLFQKKRFAGILLFLSAMMLMVLEAGRVQALPFFPIASNSVDIFLAGGVAASPDGNFLVGLAQNQTNACAQLMSSNGVTAAPLLNLGPSQGAALVAAGTTNFLATWAGNQVEGALINLDGSQAGASFNLPASPNSAETAVGYGGTNYLVVWEDEGALNPGLGVFYGQRVNGQGQFVGSPLLLGNTLAAPQYNTHAALVYGGSQFLFAWMRTNSISGGWDTEGTFVSDGGVVSGPFLISQNTSLDAMPPAAATDGTRFLVGMNRDSAHTSSGGPVWNVVARMLQPDGSTPGPEVMIDTNQATINAIAYDGANYLLVWGNHTYTTNSAKNVSFEMVRSNLTSLGPVFNLFSAAGPETPLFGGTVYLDGQFAVGCMLGNLEVNGSGQIIGLTSGVVEGSLLPSSIQPPVLHPGLRTGNAFPLRLSGTPGVNYVIQAASQPGLQSWSNLITNSPLTGSLEFTDSAASSPIRFYRASLP